MTGLRSILTIAAAVILTAAAGCVRISEKGQTQTVVSLQKIQQSAREKHLEVNAFSTVQQRAGEFRNREKRVHLDELLREKNNAVSPEIIAGHLEDAIAGRPPEKPKKEEPEPEQTPGLEITVDPATGEVIGGSEGVTYDPETGILTVPGVGEFEVDPETGMLATGGELPEDEPISGSEGENGGETVSGEGEENPVEEPETGAETDAPAEGEAPEETEESETPDESEEPADLADETIEPTE